MYKNIQNRVHCVHCTVNIIDLKSQINSSKYNDTTSFSNYDFKFRFIRTGIFLVLLIHPGDPAMKPNAGGPSNGRQMGILDAVLDLLR